MRQIGQAGITWLTLTLLLVQVDDVEEWWNPLRPDEMSFFAVVRPRGHPPHD